jgi:uncharacterized protein YjbI with pentapeptide repeats
MDNYNNTKDFQGKELVEVSFKDANLFGSNFRNSKCIRCTFDGAILYTSFFEGAELIECTFKDAKVGAVAGLPKNLPGADYKAPANIYEFEESYVEDFPYELDSGY